VRFDFDGLTEDMRYRLMLATVLPRPIAWVSKLVLRITATNGNCAATNSLLNCRSELTSLAMRVTNSEFVRRRLTLSQERTLPPLS
jgi:hypothetical protein